MKIFKLLQELYIELKIFNQNVEYFSLLEGDKKRRRENPMSYMTAVEKTALKLWITKILQEKNITIEGDGYTMSAIKTFLDVNTKAIATKPSRNYLSAALGYNNFEELIDAWRQSKGVAA